MLALPLPPMAMLVVVIILIFLLGWPFEWPAIILVFLPIFFPCDAWPRSQTLLPGHGLIWFGALVAVTLQTAYLSPPVAMSAYYLKQVVREWSLATIYKGMFEFMLLQCIAIAMILFFPAIATWLPEYVRHQAASVEVETIDDSENLLEEDPFETFRRKSAPRN